MDIIRDANVKARKDYICDASWIFHNVLSRRDLENEEDLEEYDAAKSDGFKVLKGQVHRYCVFTDGGELRTYRGRIDMDHLCQKHECFDE